MDAQRQSAWLKHVISIARTEECLPNLLSVCLKSDSQIRLQTFGTTVSEQGRSLNS